MKSTPSTLHERLTAALSNDDDRPLAQALAEARAADIAESFELLRDEDRSRILFALAPPVAAEVVILLDEAVQGEVVDDLDTTSLTELVSELEPDDAADMLGTMPEKLAGEILEHMGDEKSDKIEELLEYDEQTAGGIMTPAVVAVPLSATVGDAVEYLRDATQDDDLHEIYVVDDDRHLIGTVALRHLVTNPPATKIADLCDRDVTAVHVHDDQEAVVQIIRKYDAMEAAVVDANHRLVGRITHDDLLDVAEEEAEEDLLRMAGTDAAEFETTSVFQAARVRLSWLLPCMLGTAVTASILEFGRQQFDVKMFVLLIPFVPMIGATAGNSGIQISTVIIRGFATGDLGATKLLHVLLREGRIALAMAPVCGVTAYVLVSLLASASIAWAVATALTISILSSGFLGIALPFLFRRVGVDPAIASGPFVTTFNDTVAVSIYMTMALLLVG